MLTRPNGRSRSLIVMAILTSAVVLSGCAGRYVTPARGISMDSLSKADLDIRERMTREPSAEFPARIATVRVQDNGYRSYRVEGYGHGEYSVVTTREVEEDKDFERLQKLPMVAAVAPLNRMVIPRELRSDRELRLAAASLKADLLLAYSFDTAYRIDGRDIGPLGLITLGFLPVNEAVVTSTASAALFDVRTGYVYGLAESTAREKQSASAWTTEDAADDARIRAERKAFDNLLDELEKVWKEVVEQHAARPSPANSIAAQRGS